MGFCFKYSEKSMADLQGVKRTITEMALVCTEKPIGELLPDRRWQTIGLIKN